MCEVIYNPELKCWKCDFHVGAYCTYHDKLVEPLDSCEDGQLADGIDKEFDKGFLEDDKERVV
jgi:hypothetical protein